jgi:hypothetical protein
VDSYEGRNIECGASEMNRKKGSGPEDKNEELLDSLITFLNINTCEVQLTNIMMCL